MALHGYQVEIHGDIFPEITSRVKVGLQACPSGLREAIGSMHPSINVDDMHVE
jgi:hypothetical protein